jgi:hypothetical protein
MNIGKCIWIRNDSVILIGLIIDLIGAILMYYGKIFRNYETIE